ncbi:MAG: hypothetical protein SH847_11405 [Roseiflexaceae bacterium]|nr:hypothetical protein [Roseiflexaceae bacterium]
MSADKMGMVIRDPWYEFGTSPGHPNEPNIAFQERMGAILEDLGVRWVRLEFHIAGDDVEASVARCDHFINVVAPRHHLMILGLLSFGIMRDYPPDTSSDPRSLTSPIPDNQAHPYGSGVNEYMRKWLDRARFIADRYAGNVHAYEILNEQNRMPPSGTAIPAVLVARLHTKFYRLFRQVDRQALGDQSWRDAIQIILGGLHPKGTGEPENATYTTDLEYLYQIYASDGFNGYRGTYGRFPVDGIAYHPYPEEVRLSLRRYPRGSDAAWEATMLNYRLDELRQVLRNVGHPDVPFWITEVGYNIAYGNHTAHGQALFMDAVQRMLITRLDVAVSFWFKYEDFPPAEGPNAQQWGVVHIPFSAGPWPGGALYDPTGTPQYLRAAYHVFRALAEKA